MEHRKCSCSLSQEGEQISWPRVAGDDKTNFLLVELGRILGWWLLSASMGMEQPRAELT